MLDIPLRQLKQRDEQPLHLPPIPQLQEKRHTGIPADGRLDENLVPVFRPYEALDVVRDQLQVRIHRRLVVAAFVAMEHFLPRLPHETEIFVVAEGFSRFGPVG